MTMSAVTLEMAPTPLTTELERVELLVHCLSQMRQGQDIASDTEKLRSAIEGVED